jgi:CDGSH-type Zn-finger protein
MGRLLPGRERSHRDTFSPMSGRIDVEANGPYQVRGLPLSRTAQVETEFGEPVAWEPDDPVEAAEEYELCRCGASATKPFCDRRGCEAGFDGTETADRGPFADRAHGFQAHGGVMFDDRTLCTMAGYCGDRFTNVWAMLRDTDDPDVRARLRNMVMLCPSGRITWVPDGAETSDELPYEPSVAAIRNGPLWARGGVQVIAADGTPYEVRHRQTLCRCGQSENKPFCDGSHKEAGFTDG